MRKRPRRASVAPGWRVTAETETWRPPRLICTPGCSRQPCWRAEAELCFLLKAQQQACRAARAALATLPRLSLRRRPHTKEEASGRARTRRGRPREAERRRASERARSLSQRQQEQRQQLQAAAPVAGLAGEPAASGLDDAGLRLQVPGEAEAAPAVPAVLQGHAGARARLDLRPPLLRHLPAGVPQVSAREAAERRVRAARGAARSPGPPGGPIWGRGARAKQGASLLWPGGRGRCLPGRWGARRRRCRDLAGGGGWGWDAAWSRAFLGWLGMWVRWVRGRSAGRAQHGQGAGRPELRWPGGCVLGAGEAPRESSDPGRGWRASERLC